MGYDVALLSQRGQPSDIRMLHLFGNSHGLFLYGNVFKLVCSDASGASAESNAVIPAELDVRDHWIRVDTIVQQSKVTVHLRFAETSVLSLDCNAAKFPPDQSFIGSARGMMQTRALFANVVLSSDPILTKEPLLNLTTWQGALARDSGGGVFGRLAFEDALESTTNHSSAVAICRNSTEPWCRVFLGWILDSGIGNSSVSQSSDEQLLNQLIGFATGNRDTEFFAGAMAAHNRKLNLNAKTFFLRAAASIAFEEERLDGFRITDYIPVELSDTAEEPMVAKDESDNDELIESLRYEAEGGAEAAVANMQLGDLYYHGLRNTPVNVEAAAQHYHRAAMLGELKAELQVAKMKVLGQTNLISNQTLLETLQRLNKTSEGLALAAHLHNDGAFVARDARLSLELFRAAAALPDVSATTLANLGVLERDNGSLELAQRYLTRAAAMNDVSASFWLGEMFFTDFETSAKNMTQSFVHYEHLVRKHILREVWMNAFDCFLAKNLDCSVLQYSFAGRLGLAEASFDLATMIHRGWSDESHVEFFDRKAVLKQLYLEAFYNHHYAADVHLGEVLTSLGKFAGDEAEAKKYFLLALVRRKKKEFVFFLNSKKKKKKKNRNSSEAAFNVALIYLQSGNVTGAKQLAWRLCGVGFPETMSCIVLLGSIYWTFVLAFFLVVCVAVLALARFE